MTEWREARPALADAIVCDGLLPWAKAFLPPGARLGAQLARFRAQGCDHISLTVAAGADGPVEAMARLGFLRREIAAAGDWLTIAADAASIWQAKTDGKLSVSFHFQSATPFAPDLDLVEAFRAAGIDRAILAYNEANPFADGCHEPRNGGLSALGRRLLARMDACGMRIDLSHCGARTSLDALEAELAALPIFSHSNARALHEHERNISDEQIRACAARGGYIGVNGVGMFLGAAGPQIPQAMARHLSHIAGLAGPGRVGLGLDFMFLEDSDYGFYHTARGRWPRGYPEPPWHFFQPEQFGDLLAALEAEGFGAQEIRGILGENYLRLALPG
ncbi:membrane dipeptidase [Bosea sp. CS1GBMeth4]|uniref:dipeptidase n=1 Tax=Bosea sp. CS1GBMeth4 TaxID=1892849 RepID=UPI0016444F32|nr:membrane dipeptidase [Bosea sp. CS1GBMeth4]